MSVPSLTAEELSAAIAAVDPSAVLVPAPVLRRVIRHDRGFLGLPLQVPHRKTYLVAADTLLRLSTPEELGIDPGRQLTGTVTLLVRPEPGELRDQPREQALLECWRLLFHAHVHRVLEERWARGDLTLKGIQEAIHRIGEAEFRGACLVLRQEQLLLPPDDHRTTYIEFAAVYLELRYFAATLLPAYFPSVRGDEDPTGWPSQLVASVDADDLFRRTRLPGAPEPSPPAETASEEPIAYFRKLVRDADEASSHGNVVRGAIRRTEAARVAPAAEEPRTLSGARNDIDALVGRILAVLGTSAESAPRWKRVLLDLLDKSDQGPWPQEARLLYDLQKTCVAGEQEVRRVSVTTVPEVPSPRMRPGGYKFGKRIQWKEALPGDVLTNPMHVMVLIKPLPRGTGSSIIHQNTQNKRFVVLDHLRDDQLEKMIVWRPTATDH